MKEVPLSLHARRTEPSVRFGSAAKMSTEPVLFSGHWPVLRIAFDKSGISSNDPTVPNAARDHLLAVHQLGDACVALRFLDGFVGHLDLADLGLDLSQLRIGTIRASEWGGAAEVQDRSWHTVHIDSSVLRAHVDPQYAAVLKEAIANLGY